MKRAAHLGEPRVPTESQEQATLAHYLDVLRLAWCHVPNGGKRARTEAAIMVGHGVKPGVPDILIFERPLIWKLKECACSLTPAGRCRFHGRTPPPLLLAHFASLDVPPIGIAIELKRSNAVEREIRTEQRAWIQRLASRGWYAFVARGAGEAIDELRLLGFG